jgi:hypothetical protein
MNLIADFLWDRRPGLRKGSSGRKESGGDVIDVVLVRGLGFENLLLNDIVLSIAQ